MLIFTLFCSAVASAQVPVANTTLLADKIIYSADGQTLTAQGNVEIYFQDVVLRATAILYDGLSGRIQVTGPLSLLSGDDEIILADMAEMSIDLKQGIIAGARVLMANRLQLAAQEVRLTGDRYTVLSNVVSSYCKICASSPIPVWQIRARRVVHDTLEKRIYFEDAKLEIFGIPVAYLPLLSIPDPTVKRASGFLAPEFSTSDLLGFGVRAPYYFTLGDSADATFTPFASTNGALVFEGEFRQRFINGELEITGAVAFDDGLGGGAGRGFLSSLGNFALANGYEADFDVNIASDKSFLRQFDYTDQDRLTSELVFSKFEDRAFSRVEIVAFQTLRDNEENSQIAQVMPEFQYRRLLNNRIFGGQTSFDVSGVALTRIDGRDVVRFGADFDWRRNWFLPKGLVLGSRVEGRLDTYQVWDDPGADNGLKTRAIPTFGAELRWPWSRQTAKSLQIVEPIFQIIYSPDPIGSSSIPNEDSQQLEFDTSNLFSFNRFAGSDVVETGLRANVGVNYTRIDPEGWSLNVTIGQVYRLNDDGQFSSGSGLDGTESDIVAATTLNLPPYLQLSNRMMFDNNFAVKRNEAQFDYLGERFGISGTYAFLSADAAANAFIKRHEISLSGFRKLNDNWKVSADYRRDLVSGANISFGGTLSYGSECIQVDLSAERSFTASSGVPPTDTFGLTFRLAGFGGNSSTDPQVRKCRMQ